MVPFTVSYRLHCLSWYPGMVSVYLQESCSFEPFKFILLVFFGSGGGGGGGSTMGEFLRALEHWVSQQQLFRGLTMPSTQDPKMTPQAWKPLALTGVAAGTPVPVTVPGKERHCWGFKVRDHLVIFQIGLHFTSDEMWLSTTPRGAKWQEKKATLLHTEVVAVPNYWCTTKQGPANSQMSRALTKWGHVAQLIGLRMSRWHYIILKGQIFYLHKSKGKGSLKKNPHLNAISFPIQLTLCSVYRQGKMLNVHFKCHVSSA